MGAGQAHLANFDNNLTASCQAVITYNTDKQGDGRHKHKRQDQLFADAKVPQA
jgi:hypothetical protein